MKTRNLHQDESKTRVGDPKLETETQYEGNSVFTACKHRRIDIRTKDGTPFNPGFRSLLTPPSGVCTESLGTEDHEYGRTGREWVTQTRPGHRTKLVTFYRLPCVGRDPS